MSFHITVLLLAAVGVSASTQSGNSQAAIDHHQESPLLSAPAELVPVSAENLRFSRLLKDTANVLQFSSISNDAPPIWGIPRDGKKDSKGTKVGKKSSLAVAGSNFGRRALDYDEQIQAFEEPSSSESKIIANPYPGNEYVFVRAGKLQQHHVEAPADSEVAASVTSINNKPPRVPLALLRQKKGKRVNISPLFTEVPQVHHDVDEAAKEFVWVDQPVAVNRQGRKHDDFDDATTNPAFQEEDLLEATTIADEVALETTTIKQNKERVIFNVVTSAPRVSFETSVGDKKVKSGSRRSKTTTGTTSTSTASSTTPADATTEASTTTTTFATSTTSKIPTTAVPLVLSSSSSKAITADDKENLLTDAFHRSASSFHGFEDSQARLQVAETNAQPARVNVRPAQNGKEYEYEYIYYYYDDDDAENGGKSAEAQKKTGEKAKDGKAAEPSTSSTASDSTTSDDPSSTTVTISSSSTTSTTTLAPDVTSDADFEYEDDSVLEEEIKANSQAPELQKAPEPSATRPRDEPVHKPVSSAEKLSNSNPINQLDRSRSPKILPGKFDESVADYKLETEASQEEQVIQTQALSRGQPQLQQATASEEEDEQTDESPAPSVPVTREPSTSLPASPSTAGLDTEHMPTLARTHKDSVNVPIVIKQSSLLKAVPVSQLQTQQLADEQPSTVPLSASTTAATPVEASSEATHSIRPSPPRPRGHRLRANVTPRPSSSTTTTGAVSEQPAVEEKPVQHAARRPNFRESSRRIPSRRPTQEAAENAQVQQPAASPIVDAPARPLPIRPRFPPRNGGHTTTTTTTAAPEETPVSDAPVAATVSAAELNSLDVRKAKDAHVRAKSANDLFAFTRLQQAISSRAPSRIQPKLVAGFVNSGEVTTDAITSSEVTTVSSFGSQSGETLSAVSVEPTSTTTTTTTEAVQQEKFGRQRGGGARFGGRTRKPLGGSASAGSTTTTETPATTRSRFSGRRRASTTESPEGSVQQTPAAPNNSEAPKPRIPSRNRFASRNRVSTTEAAPTADQQQTPEADKPAAPVTPRRRPGTYQGRRRPNQIQAQTDAPTTQEETASTSADTTVTTAATSTAAPVTAGRNRFNFAAGGGRQRPGAAAGGANPVRIRGGGRLRGPTTTTTTTEAAPAENNEEETSDAPPADAEQSQSIQSENLEQPIHSPPQPESVAPQRGSGGVLGRLKNRPKLVVTTTVAPELSTDRKPSRLNGILNRRKNIGQLPGGVHVKEEVRETTSEIAEESNNHAQEQDDDHKGVVVQISSSVTESEEVNEAHAGEIVEAPSTTPGSILNRLKSQRKPGSLFRKKPDPHGE